MKNDTAQMLAVLQPLAHALLAGGVKPEELASEEGRGLLVGLGEHIANQLAEARATANAHMAGMPLKPGTGDSLQQFVERFCSA